MNLANLPNLAKMLSFCTKYLKLSSKRSQCRSKAFYNEIKFLNLNFDTFKECFILTDFGKLGKFAKFTSSEKPNYQGYDFV